MLRCPNPHEETWLVLAAEQMNARDVVGGMLGCPICYAEYLIQAGVAHFDRDARSRAQAPLHEAEEALRLAALLDLTDSRGYAILVGDTGSQAPHLREITDVQLLLVNPPIGIEMGAGLSGLTTRSGAPLPLATASARAMALDDATTPASLEAALDVVAAGGRVLAPATLPVPESLTELARDDRHWVAERTRALTSSGIVSIDRRR